MENENSQTENESIFEIYAKKWLKLPNIMLMCVIGKELLNTKNDKKHSAFIEYRNMLDYNCS